MGYTTSIAGSLRIEPPLKWAEYRGMGVLASEDASEYDLSLLVEREVVDTEDGRYEKMYATHLEAPESSDKYYDFDDQVRSVVSAFPGHRFIGYFEGVGEGNGQDRVDIWRVYVSGGKVRRIVPKVTVEWPETPDADQSQMLGLDT